MRIFWIAMFVLAALVFAPTCVASEIDYGQQMHNNHARKGHTPIDGERYPVRGNVITYYRPSSLASWDSNLRIMSRSFASVNIRLVRTRTKSKANIVVFEGHGPCEKGSWGCAEVGWQPRRATRVWLVRSVVKQFRTETAKHEFGHALGLNHLDTGCSIMNSKVNHCLQPSKLARVDRSPLKALYGPGTFDVLPAPKNFTVRPLALEEMYEDDKSIISWKMNASAYQFVHHYVIARKLDSCATKADDPAAYSWTIKPDMGLEEQYFDVMKDSAGQDVISGRYCYTIWPVNLLAMKGKFATAWYNYDASAFGNPQEISDPTEAFEEAEYV